MGAAAQDAVRVAMQHSQSNSGRLRGAPRSAMKLSDARPLVPTAAAKLAEWIDPPSEEVLPTATMQVLQVRSGEDHAVHQTFKFLV